MDQKPIIAVTDLTAGYGGLRVLHGISLTVAKGEVVGILGANGAGKTTLLRAMAGIIKSTGGTIELNGRDMSGAPDYVLSRAGIGHVPSGRELFPDLSVNDNLMMGAYRIPRERAAELHARVLELFPTLTRMLDRRAGSLSGGEQQMVAFGRALMTDPSLLLLDEPSTGLAPAVVRALFDALRKLILDGTISVVLVEQNAALALSVVQRAYVLQQGRFVLSGPAHELRGARLLEAYLGV
jgi:branched-chain amino acid transport system ATP-binding protein